MVDELNKYLEELVKDDVFPGCNYSIITNDQIYKSSVGYKSKDRELNSLDNIYDVASLTKILVTNTIIGILIDEKKIDMQDYVCKYIKEFKFKDIQILHLLTHSSGLIRKFDKFNIKNKKEFILNIEQKFKEGTNALYSDINFILLGFIIEKIYNDKLDNIAKKLVFDPLDMNNTCYNPKISDRICPTEEIGIVHDPKAKYLKGVAGHAGIFSNISDISNYVSMILNNGYFNHKQYLDLNIIDLWFTPLFIDDNGLRKTIGWSAAKTSFICNKVCGDDSIYHSGHTGCFVLIDRSNDIGIVFLSNRINLNNDKFSTKKEEIIENIYKLLKRYDYIL